MIAIERDMSSMTVVSHFDWMTARSSEHSNLNPK